MGSATTFLDVDAGEEVLQHLGPYGLLELDVALDMGVASSRALLQLVDEVRNGLGVVEFLDLFGEVDVELEVGEADVADMDRAWTSHCSRKGTGSRSYRAEIAGE